MLPNFLIIGAARCGTTSVYSVLQTHPDVYLPANKRPEPHFFLKSEEFARGLSYYEERYFSASRGQKAIGEASTSYVYGADVPKRVHDALPAVRLVCMLRNPIERAFSGYWHTVASGLETMSFEEALANEDSRKRELAGTALGEVAPFAYVERGLYAMQLRRWLEKFDRSQLHIILFEDVLNDPDSVLADLAQFLEIDGDRFGARTFRKENTSVPEQARMSDAVHDSLVDRFRNDVRSLEELLGRDLSGWLAPSMPVAIP